jgi:Leucine-rich repeat (LRR) protein
MPVNLTPARYSPVSVFLILVGAELTIMGFILAFPYFGNPQKKAAVEESANVDTETLVRNFSARSETGLSFGENELTAFPVEIFTVSGKLESLIIERSLVETIPPSIVSLSALKTMDIHESGLRQIPPEIGSLPNITRLILYNNRIAAIPPEIAGAKTLEVLDLRNNSITAIPGSMREMTGLKRLHLGGNPISPTEIENLRLALPDTLITF